MSLLDPRSIFAAECGESERFAALVDGLPMTPQKVLLCLWGVAHDVYSAARADEVLAQADEQGLSEPLLQLWAMVVRRGRAADA